MQALFVEQDLFVCLVQQCAVDDLENLYAYTSTVKELLKSPFVLSTLSKRFGIKKTFTSLYYFLEEYNHRFCRSKCLEQDLDLHLLWAVKDGDLATLKDILETYHYTTTRQGDDKTFYQLYFQAGCRGNRVAFDLLKKKGLNIRGIATELIFVAGLAYVGHTEFINLFADATYGDRIVSGLDSLTCTDSCPHPLPASLPGWHLVLHEAMRGGHLLENEKVSKAQGTLALAYAAADNVEKLKCLLDKDWQYEEISFYDEQYFGWNEKEFSKEDRLIAAALYHQSWKVLDLLTKNYKLPKFFKKFPFSDFDVECYRWVSKHLQFRDQENELILWNAACTDNLSLTKELKRYIAVNQPPSWFEEMVENNAYKVCNWMLNEYQFSLTDLEFAGDENYAYRLVQAYINSN